MLNQNCTHLRWIILHSEEYILKSHLGDMTPIQPQPLLDTSKPQRNLRSVLICGLKPQTIPHGSEHRLILVGSEFQTQIKHFQTYVSTATLTDSYGSSSVHGLHTRSRKCHIRDLPFSAKTRSTARVADYSQDAPLLVNPNPWLVTYTPGDLNVQILGSSQSSLESFVPRCSAMSFGN